MSEQNNNQQKRKEALKTVIKRLHAGESVESLKAEFGQAISGATAGEIAEAERALIKEGIQVSEIQRLCDLHVAVFRESLDEEPAPESLPGHPIFTFRMENEVTVRLLEAMAETLHAWEAGSQKALEDLRQQIENLKSIEKHFSRKENLLFPYLEKVGFEGPSAVMWGVDNEIRAEIKSLRNLLSENAPKPEEIQQVFDALSHDLREMIYKEEKILFPEALQRLSDETWKAIQEQEADIGYFNVEPEKPSEPILTEPDQEQRSKSMTTTKTDKNTISLSTGELTQKQLDLMLTHLPVDVTFVDENDQVRYFTHGKTRIFDRSPAIIGRHVQKCHPPQSVHRVQIILDDFRAGKRDVAEFWIQMGEKFIHIRYFALRDKEKRYQGCIEVTQDITPIRALKGEKRLLDDAPGYEK